MADRFRELEQPQTKRFKDVVLLATVTSFEAHHHASRRQLRQFTELFEALFPASTEEARRQAVAALSRCPHVPVEVARFIVRQPIGIAALYLSRSSTLDEDLLLDVVREGTDAHVNALARRDDLPPAVVDALVARHRNSLAGPAPEPVQQKYEAFSSENEDPERRSDTVRTTSTLEMPPLGPVNELSDADATPVPPSAWLQMHPQEIPSPKSPDLAENLRQELKRMVMPGRKPAAQIQPPAPAPALSRLRPTSAVHAGLMVRFARSVEAPLFTSVLADALSASRALATRILLDTTGQQLAETLLALGLPKMNTAYILQQFYPHLSRLTDGVSDAVRLTESVDPAHARARLVAWQRLERATPPQPTFEPIHAPARKPDPRSGTAQNAVHQIADMQRVVSKR